ncbi:MAG: hypothetical protein LQ345_004109 [Seirophora villosa]|nr:MAG: hypothetical protein LQ345_004109 [Seirophora villosa]
MALPITPKGREAIKYGEQCVPRSSPTRAMLAKTALAKNLIDNLPAASGTKYNWKAFQARWDRHLNLPSRRETREDCWNSRYLNSLKRARTATISSRNLVNFAGGGQSDGCSRREQGRADRSAKTFVSRTLSRKFTVTTCALVCDPFHCLEQIADVEMCRKDVQIWMDRSGKTTSTWLKAATPEVESKWRKLRMSTSEMSMTALTDHVNAVRKNVIEPLTAWKTCLACGNNLNHI